MKLTLENVNFNYSKFKIKDINLEFNSGEIIAITGNNAGGKTTLLGLVSGIIKPKKGKVLIDGVSLKKSPVKIGVVFQNPDSQVIFNNVYDDICFTLKNFQIPKQEWDKRINDALVAVGMEEFKNGEIFELSAGQKQRIVIANMLAINPDIIIFDESSSYLDTTYKDKFYRLILNLKEQGKLVIFATNVLEEIAFADRVIFISNGEIKFDLSKDEAIKGLELFEKNNMYVPLKLKLMREFNINSGFDDDIFNEMRAKKWRHF